MDETAKRILERRKEEVEREMNRIGNEIAYSKDLLNRKQAVFSDIAGALEKIEGIERGSNLTMSSKYGGVRDALYEEL